ncbi:CG4480 [Drosophila busckii]|uniref:CG4480 n=2 Tax=Drosophila busckii TaxID=30019 RepID=A0A0M4E623_DROBS|nr:CG4480 [Drosophila busckii]ALC39696.1 CG4480 [Drosophila busckii]
MDTPEERRQEPLRFKHEFRWRHFGLAHHALEDFHRSQWQKEATSRWFLIYRWAMALFFIIGLVSYMSHYFLEGHWFLYLTHWGFFLCSITSLSAAIFVTIYHFNPDKMVTRHCLIRCYWVCYWTNLIISHVISITYWIFVFPTQKMETDLPKWLVMGFNVLVHGVPVVLFTVDHMLVAHPTRLLHFVYPMGFGWLYGAFAYVYYLCGGVDITGKVYLYAILDFRQPGEAVLMIVYLSILLIFCHVLQYGVYRLRVYIAHKLGKLQ